MTFQVNTPIEEETLSEADVIKICGRARKDDQIAWLVKKGWVHQVNARGEPVVGRWYARMKMAGIELSGMVQPTNMQPDFSKVQ